MGQSDASFGVENDRQTLIPQQVARNNLVVFLFKRSVAAWNAGCAVMVPD